MTLQHPIWLLMTVPLAVVFLRWHPSTRLLKALRIAMVIVIVLAMCGLSIVIGSRAGTVVVVADRSLSMPPQADALERELIGAVESSRPGGSLTAVVSFGRDARVELAPGAARFGGFSMPLTEGQSNLRGGLETALALIPSGSPGRIVLLTDGRWTGRDPLPAILDAGDRGIAIDYRLIERPSTGDLAIERVDPPAGVGPGEPFAIHASVASPIEQDANIVLRRGETIIASGRQHLRSGTNRIAFRDRAGAGGLLSYTLQVSADSADALPENNQARFFVGVSGPRPVLVVAGSAQSHFAGVLKASGVAVDAQQKPEWSLEQLAAHSAVVLENLPGERIGVAGMRNLASWVSSSGGGLVVTGGRASFAAGGYFKSPLEPVLPVSMELRREHRKLRMSIVVAMDRSGSMAVSAGRGRTKMDLADLAAVQVLDLMSPQDELGVVAVDSSAHIVADLDPIEGRPDLRKRIMSVESMGGGIFIFEALKTAANMLTTAGSQTRHILLFADAADSEEPGAYKELLDRCVKANITVSVVGLGTERDVDAELLRDIARRGGGQVYFTNDPEDLPRLFAQDTFLVARSAFVDVATPVRPTPALYSLTGRMFNAMPAVGGFNLCYLREGAAPDVITVDEYRAPILASWQAGLGRVASFTGEVDGEFTGSFGSWPDAATFYSSVVRWAAGGESPLPENMLITQRVENGVAHIDLELDPERTTPGITAAPDITTLSGALGSPPVVARMRMNWSGHDRLTAEVAMSGDLTYVSSIDVPGAGRVTLPATRLPYSPEYTPAEEAAGMRNLERFAHVSGGKERVDFSRIWSDVSERRQPVSLTNWLLSLAILLLLLETVERRTRLITLAMPARIRTEKHVRAARTVAVAVPSSEAEEPSAPPVPPDSAESTTLLDALDKANQRAKKKM
jgi:Mg-chelatase subunit ChlD